MRKLESESCERDKELTEALVRIGQYENGTYGLREAVQEIKDLKKQTGNGNQVGTDRISKCCSLIDYLPST